MTNGTTNVLERIGPEMINDIRTEVAKIADPVEAVQWAKRASAISLGCYYPDKRTPERIAEAEQLAEAFLGHPRKNAKGETIEMSVLEAIALYEDEQDKAAEVQRQHLEPISLSPPPTYPKVEDLPLAITASPYKWRVSSIREHLATITDPVKAAEWAKVWALSLMEDVNPNRELADFTPEEIAELKRTAEALLAGHPCNQQRITKENDKDQASAASLPSSPPTKANGAAPVNSFPADEPTGLAEAFAPPKASKVVPQVAVPASNVVGKSAPVEQQPTLPLEKRKPLKGGTYSPDEALKLLNSHYLIGKTEQEIAIFRIKDDGSLAFTPPEQFRLDTANIFVRLSSGSDKPAEKFWRESSRRLERKIVFKPGGTTEPDEFNLWRGFGVKPRRGWQTQRRLLRHILRVICRGDKAKFKYLMRWLAWAVQNPDKHPGTINMLKSRKQGTGKSTLGVVMLKIFGPHRALIADKERLLGKFNDWLEDKCFIVAEEILWAGDHKTADQIKSLITGNTIRIERKFGGSKEIPNCLHTMMMTNHDHAVAAGVGDRRNVVYDISDERACDKTWFDPIYQDLDDGSASEFLYFLQNVKLGEWHPRQILKTAEAIEQQRMTGDNMCQWSQACIYADEIVPLRQGPYGLEQTYHLGMSISTEVLKNAYTGYCRQHGQRAANEEVFGKACAEMFGPRKRLKAQDKSANARRPWGYDVPDGDKWQEKLDARLGIKK